MASMLAIGVLTDRADIYLEAIEYFKHDQGNGAIEHAVWKLYPDALGQVQESGRDQGHTLLDIALLGAYCQMAWNQGDDLFGYDDNRLLRLRADATWSTVPCGRRGALCPPDRRQGLKPGSSRRLGPRAALSSFYSNRSTDLLDAYSRTALRRVWRAQHFSWWMTSMLHRFHDGTEFDLKRQLAEPALVASSQAAATTLAENYVGMPLT